MRLLRSVGGFGPQSRSARLTFIYTYVEAMGGDSRDWLLFSKPASAALFS